MGSFSSAGGREMIASAPTFFGVLRVADSRLSSWSLHAEHERRAEFLSGRAQRLGSFQALRFRQRGPLARKLGPHEAMDTAAIDESKLLDQRVDVELVGICEWCLRDGKDAAELLCGRPCG